MGTPHTLGCQAEIIHHVKYPQYEIRAVPTSFQAHLITLYSPHMAGRFAKMIFIAVTIIGASLRLSEGQNWAKNLHSYLVM